MRKLFSCISIVAVLTLLQAIDAAAQQSANRPTTVSVAPATARIPRPAINFEPNRGQASSSVLFRAQGPGYLLALEHGRARLRVGGDTRAAADSGMAIRFLGANLAAPLKGMDQLPGKHNYLPSGDPASWRTNIPTYGKVAYGGLYDGVDLSFYGNPDRLEYDFDIAAGGDPAQIRLALDGAERITTDHDGDLLLTVNGNTIRFLKPVAYQAESDNSRRRVDVAYRVAATGRAKGNERVLSFVVGKYNRARPLVIDPVVDYSFYLPASTSGHLFAGASTTDASGNTYIAGPFSDTDGGAPGFVAGFYVAKYNSSGQQIYSTVFGTTQFPTFQGSVNAIAVDSSGKAYITGLVGAAYGGQLPYTSNAYQTSGGGAYLGVLTADGSALTYCTYFGGGTVGRGVAVDSSGNVYIAGGVGYGNGTSLPVTTGAPVPTIPGQFGSGFLAKLNPNLSGASSLIYSTFIGAPGTYIDVVNAVAVDSAGNAYVTGNEDGAVYPVTAGAYAYDGRDPKNDVFVSKINSTGTAFIYSALLGPGSGDAIALDSSNDAYITGPVYEDDYPTTSGAYQTSYSSGFVTELNPAGSSLIYSTFLGGPNDPFTAGAQFVPQHIALSPGCASSCEAYVAGYTNLSDLPLVAQVQSYIPVGTDSAFYIELAGNGASALQSSYFASGASFDPYEIDPGIGVDSSANIYLVGNVLTSALPTTQTTGTSGEGFLAKIAPVSGSTLASSPASVNFGPQIVGVGTAKQGIAQPTVLLENLGSQAATLSSITVSPSSVFAATNNCNGSVAAGGNCTLTLNFTPGAVSTNPQNGTITVASNASHNPVIQLTGTAIDDRYIVATCGGVTPCPGLSFPDTAVGTGSAAQIVTLTNLGDTAVTLSSLASSATDYTILTNCPVSGATLAHNATCEVSVQFTPTQTGNRTGTISAASTGTTTDAIAIAVTGTGLISPNASSLVLLQTIQNFGSEVIGGTSTTMSVVVFNNGSSPATVFLPALATSGDASGVNDFSIVSNTCTGVELLPESSCTIGVAFVPTATGTRNGTLTVPNSTTTTLTSTLAGIGLAAQQTLEFSPSSVTFPDEVDNVPSSGFTVTAYNAGASPVTIDRVVISGASFLLTATTCAETTLAPSALPSQDQSCTMTVEFDPVATGAQTGSITLIDTEGRQSAFSLAGNGVAQNPLLFLSSDGLDFGYVPVGSTTAAKPVQYSSVGNVPVTITSVSTTGDFVVTDVPTLPFIANPGSGGGGYFYLAFAPTQVANPDQGTLTVTTTAGTRTVNLTGIGVQATKSLVLTPSSGGFNFGTIEVGSSATADSQSPYLVNIYNNGSEPVTLSSAPAISGTNAADFTIIYPSNCGSASPAGGSNIVSSGAYCTIYFNFKPSAAGTRTATLTLTDDASTGNGVQTIALSGVGSATAPAFQLEPLTLDVSAQAITTRSAASFLTFTNNSGTALTISSVALAPSNGFVLTTKSPYCAGSTLKANGGSCYIIVIFAPDTAGAKSATVTFTDSNNNTYVANLNGYGVPTSDYIAVTPGDRLNFEPQPLLSTSATQEITLTNTSGAPVTFGKATTTNAVLPGGSAPAAFTVTTDSCSGFTTGSGSESCIFVVDFSPTSGTAIGAQSGTISIPVTYGDGTASTVSMALNGTVVPDIDSAELSTPVFTFPDEAVNATPSANAGDGYQVFSITNKSNLAIKVGQATYVNTFNYAAGRGSSTSAFGYASDSCSGVTLQIGSACTVYIAFVPLTAGSNLSGSVSFPVTFADKTSTLTANYTGNALPAKNSLLISPNSANFGEAVVGQTGSTITFGVTNNGNQPVSFGTYTLTSTQMGTNFVRSNFDYNSCSATTLAVGSSCQFNIAFTPQNSGTINGTLTIADGSATGGPHSIPLVGTGVAANAPVAASQTTVTFGNTAVGGASPTQVVYITNESAANVTGVTYTLGGTNASDFALTTGCSSTLLGTGYGRGPCSLQVVFSPATASLGMRTATITVAYSGGGPLVITLNGTGVPPAPAVTLFPSSLIFNTQDIGSTSAAQTFSVTNTGSASLKITSAASTGSAEYAITSNGCTGTTLAVGADCLVAVTFSPTASGSHSGAITVTDNAANSPQTASLTALVPKAALNVTSLTFAAQNDGTSSAVQTATLSNTGTGPLYISTVAIRGTDAADFTQTNTCGTYVAVGGSCSISVKFAPTAAGSLTATLIVTDNTGLSAGSSQTAALSGTGTPVVATPTFTPAAGTYAGTQSVSISDTTAGSAIYYTTDGSTPTTSSTPYSKAISVSSSETIKAIASATNYANSSVGSAAYLIQPSVTASVSPTSIAFANTKVGSTSAYIQATLTNNGSVAMSGVSLTIKGTTSSSFFLPSSHQECGATLAAGASCTFDAAFEPTVAGALTASVQIADSASNSPQTVALSGTGVGPTTASISPTSISFANTKVGSISAYIEATLTNNGSAAMTGVALSITGANASSFFLPSTHQDCGTTLAAGASCTFDAAFEPTTGGALAGSVFITDSATNSPQMIALSGTGISSTTASVSPTTIAFADTKVGSTSAYISVTLTNNGISPLTGVGFSVTGANASSFFLPSDHQGCTATLAVGASCTFDAAFKPTITGALSASVQITDGATNSPQSIALTGTGN